jgi:uncharacterized membrane protein
MSQARRSKNKHERTMSDAERQLTAEAHRNGVPTFLLRLRRDVGSVAGSATWRPVHRRD